MNLNSRIYIAGHTGLFGSNILKFLENKGFTNIIIKTHSELDLTNQKQTFDFFELEKPDYVFMAAAKVGGIEANRLNMAEFAMENLKMTVNIIDAAHKYKVKKLLYLGSSCIYPKESNGVLFEDDILSGPLEPTNEGYAIAKITGIKLCEYYKRQYNDDFISCIPANVYGPNDTFAGSSHVIPALLMRFDEAKRSNAKSVTVFGSGKPKREFLYINDAVEACYTLMQEYSGIKTVNIGVGHDTSIKELSQKISDLVGYDGEIIFDKTKPDGMLKRMLDTSIIESLNFKPKISLEEGLRLTYNWYLKTKSKEENYA